MDFGYRLAWPRQEPSGLLLIIIEISVVATGSSSGGGQNSPKTPPLTTSFTRGQNIFSPWLRPSSRVDPLGAQLVPSPTESTADAGTPITEYNQHFTVQRSTETNICLDTPSIDEYRRMNAVIIGGFAGIIADCRGGDSYFLGIYTRAHCTSFAKEVPNLEL